MAFFSFGLDLPSVTHVASSEIGRVAIGNLTEPSGLRHSDTVFTPGNRREIVNNHQVIVRVFRPPDIAQHAIFPGMTIVPLETFGFEIDLMKCGFIAINRIQMCQVTLQALV